MRSLVFLLLLPFLVQVTVLWPRSSAAQTPAEQGEQSEPGEVADESPEHVEITIVAPEAQPELFSRIRSWFPEQVRVTGKHQLSVTHEEVLGFRSPDTVGVWLFLSDESNIIYAASSRDENVHFLRRDLEGGSSEAALESLSQAVHYLVTALWQGSLSTPLHEMQESLPASPSESTADGPLEPAEDAPEERQKDEGAVTPPPPSPARRDSPGRYLLSGGYGVNAQAREPIAHGPEVAFALEAVPHLWFGAQARWIVPEGRTVEAEDSAAFHLRSTGAKLAVFGAGSLEFSERWALMPLVGAGVAFVHWEASDSPQAEPGSGLDVRPLLTFGLGARYQVDSWQVLVQGTLDAHLIQTRYVTSSETPNEVASNSGIVAPGGTLSIGYRFDAPR